MNVVVVGGGGSSTGSTGTGTGTGTGSWFRIVRFERRRLIGFWKG
jgi:hypothetical protein